MLMAGHVIALKLNCYMREQKTSIYIRKTHAKAHFGCLRIAL
jgi:hypothetical protein